MLVAAVVVLAVSVISGLGLGWISTTVFSTPDKVRLAITPATALGWTVAQVVPVGARGLESALGVVAFGLSCVLGAVLLWRSRRGNMVRNLGIALIAVAVCGPAAWPWYLTWGLVLLAACPGIQQSRALALAVAASVLVVKADGILAFPLHTAPVFVVLYVAAADRRGGRGVAPAYRRPRPLDCGRSPSPDGDADRGPAGPGA